MACWYSGAALSNDPLSKEISLNLLLIASGIFFVIYMVLQCFKHIFDIKDISLEVCKFSYVSNRFTVN